MTPLLLLVLALSILAATTLAIPGANGNGIRKPPPPPPKPSLKDINNRVRPGQGSHATQPGSDVQIPISDGANVPGVRQPPTDSEVKAETRAMAGGWSSAAVTDAEIVKCSEFAMAKGSFASQSVAKFVVTSAKLQVVAGLNVEMTVEVHIDGKCFVRSFQVYDRFGTLSLTKDEAVVGSSCTTK